MPAMLQVVVTLNARVHHPRELGGKMRTFRVLTLCCFVIALLGAADPAMTAQPGLGQRAGGGAGGLGQAGLGMRPRAAPVHSGIKMRSYTFEPTGEKLSYAVFVPRKLDKSRPAPLVIALHAANAAPEAILNPLASAADKHGYILVAPMGYAPVGWFGFERRMAGPAERETSKLSEQDVMNVMGLARAEFNIDPRRIYVAGASMGGVGAVHLAMKYKDIWAAVGVISPAITANVPEVFTGYDAAPVLVLHGDKDDGVPVGLVRDWVAGLKERRIVGEYTEYRGGTHISVVQQAGEKVFKFFDKHARSAPAP
jgi:poly(3-hydroxybutyrate) depolymerase